MKRQDFPLNGWQLAIAAGLVAIGASVAAPTAQAQVIKKKESKYYDPVYNVCRGTSPECLAQNNGWAPMPESTRSRVLIYSRTAGPRHSNLGPTLELGLNPPLTEANVMQNTLIAWLADEGITADWTEDPNQLRPNNYGAVILASGNRDNLWDINQTSPTTPMTNLRNYMRRGGGVVAIHNAFGANYNWPYYEGLLGNANFFNHGPNRVGTVQLIGSDASTTGAGVAGSFEFQDEWYHLEPFPKNVKFLAKVTAEPGGSPHPGHPDFHPVAWCQYFDGGRVWATTMGHNTTSFNGTGVGAGEFKKMMVAGIKSAMGLTDFCN